MQPCEARPMPVDELIEFAKTVRDSFLKSGQLRAIVGEFCYHKQVSQFQNSNLFSKSFASWYQRRFVGRDIQELCCWGSVPTPGIRPGDFYSILRKQSHSNQESQHVQIRQIREDHNREAISISGPLPHAWFGVSAPLILDPSLEKQMKESINNYMTSVFGASISLFLFFKYILTEWNWLDKKQKHKLGQSPVRRSIRHGGTFGQYIRPFEILAWPLHHESTAIPSCKCTIHCPNATVVLSAVCSKKMGRKIGENTSHKQNILIIFYRFCRCTQEHATTSETCSKWDGYVKKILKNITRQR